MKRTNKKARPFHEFIPLWMVQLLEQKECRKCGSPILRTNVRASGVRQLENGEFCFFAEHRCPKCEYAVCTNFDHEKTGNLEDLCYDMIDQMHKNKQIQKAREKEKNIDPEAIKDAEVRDCLRFMEKAESHEDFLKYIGADRITLEPDED